MALGWTWASQAFAALALAAALAPGARAARPCSLPGPTEPLGALELADRAGSCLGASDPAAAGKIFYAQAIRSRALAKLDPSPEGWARSAERIQSQVGAPVNRHLGGDVDEWVAAIDWALAWDESAPWPEGDSEALKLGRLDDLPRAKASSRVALRRLREDVSKIDVAQLCAARKAAGMPTRERAGSKACGSAR